MNRRNLLLVAYHFPPVGGSGVQRALKLARYLPESGWNVHVLTAGHRRHPLVDETMSTEIGDGVRVHRVRGFEPGAIAARLCRPLAKSPRNGPLTAQAISLCHTGTAPDDQRHTERRADGSFATWLEDRLYWRLDRAARRLPLCEMERLWVPAACRAARRVVRRHDIHAVITTSPPHVSHWIGRSLRRRLGIPWIADLRDPILDNFAYDARSAFIDRRWRRLERFVTQEATRVVVTCPELMAALCQRYASVPRTKFATIFNGYDAADAPPSNRIPAEPRTTDNSNRRFVLAHVGAFYRDQSVEPLLTAMRRLIAGRPEIAGSLELRLVGSLSAGQLPFLRHTDDAFLRRLGYKPHGDAIAEMAAADALFLMLPLGSGGRCCIPAKTFEYLAFGRHVIAAVHPETILADVLRRAGNVTLVEHHDGQDLADALARAIACAFDAWAAATLQRPRDFSLVEQFRRDRLAQAYADLLNQCTTTEGASHKRATGPDFTSGQPVPSAPAGAEAGLTPEPA